ncbi:MAG: efflux RND transporter periplasmic adaptor subunit, partial [Rikenellaceae bacterium]
ESKKSPKTVQIISVKAFEETPSDYNLTVSYPARVVSQDMITLGVEVTGKIERGDVPLKTGQTFRKGDLLFGINKDDVTAKLISAKSKYITMLSQVLPDINVDFKSEYPKWEKFFNEITLEGKLPKMPAFGSSKEKVYVAAKGILSAYYDIVSQEITATKHNIYAPFNGIFTSITKEVGAIASANSQVGTISATDNLDIVASVMQTEANRIRLSGTATVLSRDGKEFSGKVTRISSYVDSKTQMVDVYINIHEPSRSIIEGEMVSVTIPIGVVKNVIQLPVEAVSNNSMVYGVDNENKIYFIPVKVEYQYGEWAYISGIQPGAKILQESLITPVKGMQVNVIDQHIQ